MMEFITNIEKNEYDNFWLLNKHKSHFLQSTLWGDLKSKSGLIPHYVGIKENGNFIFMLLVLQKKLPLGYSYFYAPRALSIEIEESKYLSFITKSLKEYIKNFKGIFLKIDPAIVIDENNKEKYLEIFKSNQYRHLGFTQNFETAQPRFTYRINLDAPIDEIIQSFDVTAKQRYRKALKYQVKSFVGSEDNIKDFTNLIIMTEKRKGFFSHAKDYYQELFEVFKDNAKVFCGTVNPTQVISSLKLEIANLKEEIEKLVDESKKTNSLKKELNIKLESLTKDYEKFAALAIKYHDEVIVSSYIIVYYLEKAWVLYGANHDEFLFTNANYHLYYFHINYAKEMGIKVYDLFGCVGPKSEDTYLKGLNDFKSKFGGSYIEFIGEFDLITNKIMYFIFTKIIPLYRKLINKLMKLKNKHEGVSNDARNN